MADRASTPGTTVRLLRPADVDSAMALKDIAEWNQLPQDWSAFLELAPDGSFVMEKDGRLIATSTAIAYPSPWVDQRPFGWIGMVIVEPAQRRRGFGRQMLLRAIRALEDRGVTVALDASDDGRPLYESEGFVVTNTVERRIGVARAARSRAADRPAPTELTLAALDELRELDAWAFRCDRSKLLRNFLARPGAWGLLHRDAHGEPAGYLIVRPGASFVHLGPVVATAVDVALDLVREACDRLAGHQIGVDVTSRHDDFRDALAATGLAQSRRLSRMVKAPDGVSVTAVGGDPARVFAAAGFEWG